MLMTTLPDGNSHKETLKKENNNITWPIHPQYCHKTLLQKLAIVYGVIDNKFKFQNQKK